jgi:hypothetical protein
MSLGSIARRQARQHKAVVLGSLLRAKRQFILRYVRRGEEYIYTLRTKIQTTAVRCSLLLALAFARSPPAAGPYIDSRHKPEYPPDPNEFGLLVLRTCAARGAGSGGRPWPQKAALTTGCCQQERHFAVDYDYRCRCHRRRRRWRIRIRIRVSALVGIWYFVHMHM